MPHLEPTRGKRVSGTTKTANNTEPRTVVAHAAYAIGTGGHMLFRRAENKRKRSRNIGNNDTAVQTIPLSATEFASLENRAKGYRVLLLKQTKVPFDELDVIGMLSLSTELVTVQRMLSIAYDQCLLNTHTPKAPGGTAKSTATGQTIEQRVNELVNERYGRGALLPNPSGPGKRVMPHLDQAEITFLAAQAEADKATALADEKIRQAVAVKKMQDTYDPVVEDLKTIGAGVDGIRRLFGFGVETKKAAIGAIEELNRAGTAVSEMGKVIVPS